MPTSLRLLSVFVLSFFAAGLTPAALVAGSPGLASAEAYVYKIKYQGFLSAGSEVEIADAVLRTLRLNGSDYREAEFWITSKDYEILESVYPFRYRMRSWYDGDADATHAFETFNQNRRKTKHRLYLMNRTDDGVARVDLEKHPEAAELERLRAAEFPDAPRSNRPERFFDRLSVFQYLRGHDIQPGEKRHLTVMAGKKRVRYEVTGGEIGDVQLADKSRVRARKYLIDRIHIKSPGDEKRLGDPITAWMAADSRRTPLRAEFPHKLGDIVIEMVPRTADSVSYETLVVGSFREQKDTWW